MTQKGSSHPWTLWTTHRTFRRLWTGESLSLLGDRITGLALPLTAVLILHARAATMGYLTAAGLLPFLILALPLGMWIDKRGHYRIVMIAADVARAIALLSISTSYALGWLTTTQLLIVATLMGVFRVAFDVAYPSLVTSIVGPDQYLAANVLLQGSRAASGLVGPGLGGLLVRVITAPLALIADAVSFVVSAIGLTYATPQVVIPRKPSPQDITAGLTFLWGSPPLRFIILALGTVNLFNFMFVALYVLYATRALHINALVLGVLFSVGAVGTALGALTAIRITEAWGSGKALALGVVAFTVPLILVPIASGNMVNAVLLLGLAEIGSGFGVMVLDISLGSLSLALIPDPIRARATGAFTMVNYGIRPIGALLGGWLPHWIGVHDTLWIATVGAVFGSLWLLPKSARSVRTKTPGTTAPNGEIP